MNDELRIALAEYLRNQALTAKGGFDAPSGPEGPSLPQLAMQGGSGVRPELRGEYSAPMGAGDLTMRGNFAKPGAQDPASWGAMLGYRKPF
jgi:hypothetical protein